MIPLPAEPPHDKTGAVFARIGTELAALTAVAEDLQDTFGTSVSANAGGSGLHADALRSLQGLDLLTQTLDALSRFMVRLGEDPTTRGSLDLTQALRAVSLSALAARLAGVREDDDCDTEFDLF